MSKTVNLRTVLQAELEKVHKNTYHEDAPSTTTYPYMVYELESIQDNFQLEINVYDKGTSTQQVEVLADAIEAHFKRFIWRDDEQIFTTYKNTRNNMQEEDKTIKRRRLLFDVYYHGKDV
ncbi:MAG: hypothetical protein RR090_12175 [Niameybacter sp.]